jgi:hypothetical protein
VPAEPETQAVAFEVIGVESVNRGRLIGLAIVDVEIAGVGLRLQGVQILRGADGGLECRAPVWRHPSSGRWLPGLILPPELSTALAADVLAAFADGRG